MVWDTCNITFTNGSNGVFYTNDIVTGSVILNVKEKSKINQIDIHVKGVSRAMWTRPSPTKPYVKIYSEKRKVFNVLIDIFRDLKDVTVKPGVISRQFHFFLPSDLPSTYEDSVAKVYYKITIKSKGGWALSKKKNTVFKVINHVDLTQFDDYKIPMLYEIAKTFGKSSHFVMHFKTYNGFSTNQLIKFEAIITNEKKIKVTKLKVALIQKVDYSVSSGYSSSEKTICESYFTDVLSLTEQSCDFNMEIPQVVPSTTNVQDPMVNISYFLRVKVVFRFHLPLFSDIPVTIGTVSLNHKSFEY